MRKKFIGLFFIFFQTIAIAQIQVIPPVLVPSKKFGCFSFSHGNTTIIGEEEISASMSSSLSQVLSTLGNLQINDISGNGSQAQISIRGFGSNAGNNSLILIDDIPIVNPDLASVNLNNIPVNEIESIEITAGSEGALYGDQAVGGVVNIHTKNPVTDHIDISTAFGSFKQIINTINFNKEYHNLYSHFYFLHNHNDGYRVHNQYDQNLGSGFFAFPDSFGNTRFNYIIANERQQYPGALTHSQAIQNPRQATNDKDFFKNWNGFFHLYNQQNLLNHWCLETNLVRREMHGSGVLMSPFSQLRVIHFFKPQLKGVIGNSLLNTGMDFQNDNYYLKSAYGVTNNSQQKFSIFGLLRFPLWHKISISCGTRWALQHNILTEMSKTNSTNQALATTLGASIIINPITKFFIRRADSFRFPKADENAFAPTDKGLKTQTGVSYETGIQWNYCKTSGQFSLYQLNLQNEIAFDPLQTPQRPFGSNKNLDPTQRQGFSIAEQFHVNLNLILGGQYHFVDARFQHGIYAGKRIPLVSENLFQLNSNYCFCQHFNFYQEIVYTGNYYSDNDNANSAGRNGGYTVYNFAVNYNYQNLTASLRVNNLFDKAFYAYVIYQPFSGSEYFYPSPRRNFLLQFKYVIL